ncbi:MAG TPA: CPBP family intramembrane glutamic endopeptidase [Planctomycetota bacterium]|nr:CPBP family intramembrane glutamic endopeptidase [Planctomycetota bacterium]
MRDPDALDAARVLALALLAVAAAGLLPGSVPPAFRGALVQLGFVAAPVLYVRLAGLDARRSHGLGLPPALSLLLVAVASVASLWLLKSLADAQADLLRAWGLEDLVKGEEEGIRRRVDQVQQRVGLAGIALFAVIPPLCEEMLFRGVFFRGLVRGAGPVRALLYSALLFAAMHQTVVQISLMTFLGLYFGAVVWLTGSLWSGVLAHAINNAAVLILTLRYGEAVNDLRAPFWMVALSGLVFIGALASLALLRTPEPPSRPAPGP